MKKLLTLFAALFCCLCASAQDVILKKDGNEIKAKVLEITDSEIKYKDFDLQNGTIRNIPIDEVFMITYQTGKKELFNTQTVPESPAPAQNAATGAANAQEGITINGVTWATRNVGIKGSFVDNPEDCGKFYTVKEAATACPLGWRLPTKEEFEDLLSVGTTWVNMGATGRMFTYNGSSIFLPACGCHDGSRGTLSLVFEHGLYMSSTRNRWSRGGGVFFMSFTSNRAIIEIFNTKYEGLSCRCVKDE
jgi:uncharacterized protein (TIGR02145 family)